MGAEQHFINWNLAQLEAWKKKAQESELFFMCSDGNRNFISDDKSGSKYTEPAEDPEEKIAQNFLIQVKALFAPFNYRIWNFQQIKELNKLFFNSLAANSMVIEPHLFLPVAVPLHKDFSEQIKKNNFQVIHLRSELLESAEIIQFDKSKLLGAGLYFSQIVHIELDNRLVKREIRKFRFLAAKNFKETQSCKDFKDYQDMENSLEDAEKINNRVWRCPVKIVRVLYYMPLTELNKDLDNLDNKNFNFKIEQKLVLTTQGPALNGKLLMQVGWLLDSFYVQTESGKSKKLINIGRSTTNLVSFLDNNQKELKNCFGVSEVEQFAQLTGDFNPLHLDIEFCQQRGLDKPVIHGLLLAAHVDSLFQKYWPLEYAKYDYGQWDFLRSVQLGEEFWVHRKDNLIDVARQEDTQLKKSQLGELSGGNFELNNLINLREAERHESVELEIWTAQGLAMTMIRCPYDLRNSH